MRLEINSNHSSWEDDSTGPKGENTEEAEVGGNGFLLIKTISADYKEFVETKPRDLWTGGLPDTQDPGGDGWSKGYQ